MARTTSSQIDQMPEVHVISPLDALQAAPTMEEVLLRPAAYAMWYNGVRKEALGETPTIPAKPRKDWRP